MKRARWFTLQLRCCGACARYNVERIHAAGKGVLSWGEALQHRLFQAGAARGKHGFLDDNWIRICAADFGGLEVWFVKDGLGSQVDEE